jgi:hypothetical protein
LFQIYTMKEGNILDLITLRIKKGSIRVLSRLQINSGALQTTKCAFHDPSLPLDVKILSLSSSLTLPAPLCSAAGTKQQLYCSVFYVIL